MTAKERAEKAKAEAAEAKKNNVAKYAIGKKRVSAKFAANLNDCTGGAFEVISVTKKDSGNWMIIRLHDGQVLIISVGELASEHEAGKAIFDTTDKVLAEDGEYAFISNLAFGIKNKSLTVGSL